MTAQEGCPLCRDPDETCLQHVIADGSNDTDDTDISRQIKSQLKGQLNHET